MSEGATPEAREPGPGPDSAAGEGTPARSSAKFRIAATGDFEGLALRVAPWDRLGADVEVVAFPEVFGSARETIDALRDFDAVTLMRERVPLTREILEHLPRLKLIVFCGRMNETLDDKAAADLNITVCNPIGALDDSPDRLGGKSPAELTVALMLACTWQTGRATTLIREGGWAFEPGIPLRGKTLGIVGYGDLGRSVARLGLALGMNVLGFGRSLTDAAAQADGVVRADLDQLLAESDVVSVHLRLAPATRGLIGPQQIARLKDGVIFINTARAQIVDEQPFLDALRSGKIAMAGLDVFWEEPLPADHPLKTIPNVVMTPHIGYATQETLTGRYQDMLETLVEYRRGNVINRYPSTATT